MFDNYVDDYVNLRLIDWAKWYNQANKIRLGYPTRSIEWKILHEGIVHQRQRGPELVETNPAAEEIEEMLMLMAKQDNLMAAVIRKEYTLDKGQREKAELLKISPSYYCMMLKQGMKWLAGGLTAKIVTRRL